MTEEKFDYPRIIEDLKTRYEEIIVVYESRINQLEEQLEKFTEGNPKIGII